MPQNKAVRVIADSIAENGKRLTTLEVDLWRPLLAEFNTHRALSRNSASSRAIPVAKMMERIKANPFFPKHWGKNQKGMQAGAELPMAEVGRAKGAWKYALEECLSAAEELQQMNVHKSIPNRLLEPWMVTTIVVSATEWENFCSLRTELNSDGDPMAEHHFYMVAEEIIDTLNASEPVSLRHGQWHLPYVRPGEMAGLDWDNPDQVKALLKCSVARCARVSYLKQDGLPATSVDDFMLHDMLLKNGHMSPFEHQGKPALTAHTLAFTGNFIGWTQYRKTLPGEIRKCNRLQKKEWKP